MGSPRDDKEDNDSFLGAEAYYADARFYRIEKENGVAEGEDIPTHPNLDWSIEILSSPNL